MNTLYGAIRGLPSVVSKLDKESTGYRALLDDLNSPIAISELHRLAKQLNKTLNGRRADILAEMLGLADVMGLLQQDPEEWFTLPTTGEQISVANIEQLIAERQQAKLSNDYVAADQIRHKLLAYGVILEDDREGCRWRRK